MLSSVSDYEYYGGDFLSGATISGDIIPIEDAYNRIPLLRFEDCAYLMETYTGVFNDGYKSWIFSYPIDKPTLWQTALGRTSDNLYDLRSKLETAHKYKADNPQTETPAPYSVQVGSVFLLNEFDTMQEWERVSTSSQRYSYYQFIWDNNLTLSSLPVVDGMEKPYYNSWIASKFPVDADYPRQMYWYLLNTKVGYGVPSWSSRYRHWYGWKCESVNRWAKSFSESGVSFYADRNYTYGNSGFGSSQYMGWTYYIDDKGRERYSQTVSWRTRDYGNLNDCWMIKEGQNTSGGAEFTLSRKPKSDVYYLWNLRFRNTGDTSLPPLLYHGVEEGMITQLEKLEPVQGDTTGLKYKAKKYGNSQYLAQIATTMGFDMQTIGSKNTSGSTWETFKRRRGV